MKKITNSSSEESEFTYYGLLVDIFEEIKKELNGNFPKYQIVEDSEGLYGTHSSRDEPDAQWNGAVNTIYSVLCLCYFFFSIIVILLILLLFIHLTACSF
jgi:hypothetical protein